jgi:undecaprenyl-diphosphatase
MNQDSLAKNKYAEYVRDFTALGNPFLLFIVAFAALQNLPQASQHLLTLVLVFLLNEVICSGIKYLWHKPRPNQQGFSNGFEKIEAGSFPSIHAARVAWVYGYLSLLYYPLQAWGALVMFGSIILLVGYSRIFLRKHFLTDVLAGYGFGAVLNVLVAWLC